MKDRVNVVDQGKASRSGGAGTVLYRLMWIFIGPLSLAIIAYRTVKQGDGWLTPRDVAWVIILALMIGARWLEVRSGAGETAAGEPATMAHFKRYATVLVPVTAVLWIAAKIVGNHVLN